MDTCLDLFRTYSYLFSALENHHLFKVCGHGYIGRMKTSALGPQLSFPILNLLPISGTQEPKVLADADSKFIRIRGIDIHYKDYIAGGTDVKESSDHGSPSAKHNAGVSILMLHGFNGSEHNFRCVK